jgi:LysM repeat protein
MSLSNTSLKSSLRLTAATLALTLAGCGGNPPAYESSQAAPTPTSGGTSLESAQGSYSEPAAYEPVLERINEPVPLAAGHPNEYVVQVGDTLWDIAGTFLKDPWYWPEIWYVNPDIVNPHLIYPGDVLGLVYIDGQPRVTNVRASTYRMSPQARVTPLTESISSIPYEDVAAFLSSGFSRRTRRIRCRTFWKLVVIT